MRKVAGLIVGLFVLLGVECQDVATYVLSEPKELIKLSSELNEVSGLSSVSDSLLLCIQDEKGTLYFLNTEGQVVHKYFFGDEGDYEGVAVVVGNYYVLRSNGDLFCIEDGDVRLYRFVEDGNFDFEGLCYDEAHHRLLLACKTYPGKNNSRLLVYGFDVNEQRFIDTPVYDLTKDANYANFKPSACAVHPRGNLYVLSSVSKQLIVLNSRHQIVTAYDLDKSLFNQPEGITFFTNGDLYISNEKRHLFPSLLKFEVKNVRQK